MGLFGWDLPPGVSSLPGEYEDCTCLTCGKNVDYCDCPECVFCGNVGDPACYELHGMILSAAQEHSLKKALEKVKEYNAYWDEMDKKYPPEDM